MFLLQSFNNRRNCDMYLLFQLFALSTVLELVKSLSCAEDSTFIKDKSFSNLRILEGEIRNHDGVENQASCALKCKRRSDCRSFFFNKNTAKCQINSVIYLSKDGSEVDEGAVFFRKKMECPALPSVPNSQPEFDVNSAPNATGTVLKYTCNVGYSPQGSVRCQVDGTWTQMSCTEVIRSCSEVKACNSQYGDGEYWIYPAPYGTTKVKIYCHGMNSGSPTEYVTLNVVNKAYYPGKSSQECGPETFPGCSNGGGETHYTKIRVDIQTMEVDRIDSTFSTTVFGSPQNYGEANDCYTIHYGGKKQTCGPKGTFNIDTTGTGLIIKKTLTFPVSGWNAWGQTVRNTDGTKIDLLCGGWSGGCAPSGAMTLELVSTGSTVPSSSSAVDPMCS
ncbi:A disintegrin and metalloproteinase with thrombospondin motifs 20-like isoform X2 [Gigantopelta aegis]|uniref:A disintegrin and metalloproteinase with thrombospondin motifs 20-like isoform X2 n=1 Tax=Gigantopelta aegis TaxID=1735272 RepID=UPI001B88BCC3|nr:A disintegrin and metalloproteinase with thrombospondin motifs 20-like isoform X2 [Gigantopelta aegis]